MATSALLAELIGGRGPVCASANRPQVPQRRELALFSGLRAGNQSHFRPQVLE